MDFGRVYRYRGGLEWQPPRVNEPRGHVFAYESGAGLSHDRDLGGGWKYVAAVRSVTGLSLYVDGQEVAASPRGMMRKLDISSDAPLRIGFGSQSYFC